ncbi:MAG: hypothetical protein IKE30_05090, partial [Clostridia bacterium]|nr:hypothetical protein [Clostridia bacterium]
IVTPSVFLSGDTIKAELSLTNTSGKRLTGYRAELGFIDSDSVFVPLADFGRSIQGFPNRSTRKIHLTAQAAGDGAERLAETLAGGERAAEGLLLRISAYAGSETFVLDTPLDGAMIDQRFCPAVEPGFEVVRCDAGGKKKESGEHAMVTAKVTSAAPYDGFALKMYIACGHPATEEDRGILFDDCAQAFLDGVKDDATLMDETFDKSRDWFFLLAWGDKYETAYAEYALAQARTNLHESSWGGLRLGGYSHSTREEHFFESDYPALLYGGIENLQAGYAASPGAVNAGTTMDIPVKFRRPFACGTVPVVTVSVCAKTNAGAFGRCGAAVLEGSVTSEGFTIRFYNGDSVGRIPGFSYIALGIPATA